MLSKQKLVFTKANLLLFMILPLAFLIAAGCATMHKKVNIYNMLDGMENDSPSYHETSWDQVVESAQRIELGDDLRAVIGAVWIQW